MTGQRTRSIKHAQKESLLFREISRLFQQIFLEDERLKDIQITRVKLSPEKGMCSIYFYSDGKLAHFEEIRPFLVMYKPSLRTALAKSLQARYTPELRFKFDEILEKNQRIQDLIDDLKIKGEL